jgi:hypothetical protein
VTMNDKPDILLQPDRGSVGLLALLMMSCVVYLMSQGAHFGDSITYAVQIDRGALIEPGHLIWRPLSYAIGHLLGTVDTYSSTVWTLQGVCLAASLAGLAAVYRLCRNVAGPEIALCASGLTAVSNGYWAYAFSGCSYTLGVLFQAVALHYAITMREPTRDSRNAILAGSFGGLAACAWAINVLEVPAICAALIAASLGRNQRLPQHLRTVCAFAFGYVVTFVLPVAFAYGLASSGVQSHPSQDSSDVTASQWLAATHHGIPVHFGAAQMLRAAFGWAQSVVSISDLGYRMRLWHFREGAFPFSFWGLTLALFYVAILIIIVVLVKGRTRLDSRSRWLVYAAAFGVVVNLAFGVAWQGSDLERYLPSWPFQMILLAVTLNMLWERGRRAWRISLAIATLGALVIVNWLGTFESLLGANSFRHAWVSAIREHASRGDLVILFGQRKAVILAPHDENFPKVHDVSNEIIMRGPDWRSAEIDAIRLTQSHGGRVFLGDSLFWLDTAPRDGWSFKEYPVPTPSDLHNAFLPFKSDTVAFTVGRERVWEARAEKSP